MTTGPQGIPGLIERLQDRAEFNAVRAAGLASDIDFILSFIRNEAGQPFLAESIQAELDDRRAARNPAKAGKEE